MKAIIQEKYGSIEDLELREVAKPAVGDDEVLVRVRAASLHPDVWHVVSGRPYVLRLMGAGFFKPRNPIPGTDMAGIVESVGKNVTRFRQGDEVFGETTSAHQWTNAERDSLVAALREQLRQRGAADQDWSKVPRIRPAVMSMHLSDEGDLWVETPTASGTSLIRSL
jgi:NADPH:quinone reductase-like Zn-dependent oxidoreductase